MHRFFKIILCLSLSVVSQNTLADLQASTNIQWSAEIVNWGCNINTSSSTITVPLGVWSTAGFKKNSVTTPVEFEINLSECSANTVSVTFSGIGDEGDYLPLSSDSSATGIGVQLKTSDKKIISMHNAANPVSIDSSGRANLVFFANYIGLDNHITAGTANAATTFILNYD